MSRRELSSRHCSDERVPPGSWRLARHERSVSPLFVHLGQKDQDVSGEAGNDRGLAEEGDSGEILLGEESSLRSVPPTRSEPPDRRG